MLISVIFVCGLCRAADRAESTVEKVLCEAGECAECVFHGNESLPTFFGWSVFDCRLLAWNA